MSIRIFKIALILSAKRGKARCFSSHPRPLIDNFHRGHDYLRISLTERCNLRCKYCMPEEGVQLSKRDDCLNLNELKRLSDIFVGLCGVRKIRLTGGEPTVDKKLFPLMEHLNTLRQYGLETLALTTNGLTLKRHSSLLAQLGLDSLNISLDTLKEDRFETMTRRKGWRLVYEGLLSAIETNFDKVKLNCVLMKGFNDDEILDFANLARIYPIEVRFIEFMPFEGNKWDSVKLIPYKQILETLLKEFPDLKRLESRPNEVSKVYKDESMRGSIGFISSMSENFCSGCNRLRITSDGNLKVCLFGKEETSLRNLLRNGASDLEIVEAVARSLKRKRLKHSDASQLQFETSRPMIKIGG